MEREIDSEGHTVADAILDVLERIADSLEELIKHIEETKSIEVDILD